jgi:hypothetical protein
MEFPVSNLYASGYESTANIHDLCARNAKSSAHFRDCCRTDHMDITILLAFARPGFDILRFTHPVANVFVATFLHIVLLSCRFSKPPPVGLCFTDKIYLHLNALQAFSIVMKNTLRVTVTFGARRNIVQNQHSNWLFRLHDFSFPFTFLSRRWLRQSPVGICGCARGLQMTGLAAGPVQSEEREFF